MASGSSSLAAAAEVVEMVGVVVEPWFHLEVGGIEKVRPHWVSEQHEHLSSDDVAEHVDQMAGVGVDYAAVEGLLESLTVLSGLQNIFLFFFASTFFP